MSSFSIITYYLIYLYAAFPQQEVLKLVTKQAEKEDHFLAQRAHNLKRNMMEIRANSPWKGCYARINECISLVTHILYTEVEEDGPQQWATEEQLQHYFESLTKQNHSDKLQSGSGLDWQIFVPSEWRLSAAIKDLHAHAR